MNNRIKMLQVEEEKVLRKIEETRKKANHIQEIQAEREKKSSELASKKEMQYEEMR